MRGIPNSATPYTSRILTTYILGKAGWSPDEIYEFLSTPASAGIVGDVIMVASALGWRFKDFKTLSPRQIRHLALLVSESKKHQNADLRDNTQPT